MFWQVLMWIVASLFFIFGIGTIFLSTNEGLVRSLPWDPSMCGLGVAIVALAFYFADMARRRRDRE